MFESVFVCAEISVQYFLPYLNQLQYIYVLHKVWLDMNNSHNQTTMRF